MFFKPKIKKSFIFLLSLVLIINMVKKNTEEYEKTYKEKYENGLFFFEDVIVTAYYYN